MIRHPKLSQVVPGLYMLEGQAGGRFPHSHCFVIDGDPAVLVDAGCGLDLLAELTRMWRPEMLILSHSHPDHCAGAWMLESTRILSPVQRSESFWRFAEQSLRFAGEEVAPLWVDFVAETMGIREVEADGHFENGTVFDLGTIRLECHHAPGHTEDHYVLFEPHHGIALTFDIDLTTFGPWYGHEESDIELFLSSIQRVIELEPRMVLSSHKGLVTDDIEGRLRRFAAVIEHREARLLELLEAPRSLHELVDLSPIYGGHPYAEKPLRYWEGQMISKHLERMARRGVVSAEHPNGDRTSRWRRSP
jgi:glyoxylase-like metal-dependent hydrolase (beta-lactamase superfamily II)